MTSASKAGARKKPTSRKESRARKKPEPKLKTYKAKRDFTKTAEPSGDLPVAKSKNLRFAIQKHAATRLHYDLRLELDGVFKSWAVTRGPSLNPADKRLAVEVEDHPLDYGDFEGTIPKGEYGGGTVLLWDRGYWAPEPGTDIETGLRKGDFKFLLAGEKLNGSWVLVRLKPREGEKRNNWLLIKHRDQYAREDYDVTEAETASVASGREMEQIAAGKGKKPKPFMLKSAAMTADAVWHSNKNSDAGIEPGLAKPEKKAKGSKSAPEEKSKPTAASSKLIMTPRQGKAAASMPDFVKPQLAGSSDAAPTGSGWAHEVKLDGYRVQVRVEDREVALLTRKGLDWTARFAALAKEAKKLPDCIIDGELVALDGSGQPSFPKLQDAIASEKTDDLAYFAFDLLFTDGKDLRALPLRDRKAQLEAFIADNGAGPIVRYTTHVKGNGAGVVEAARGMELEGIVSKRLDAPYRSGRSESWVKIKLRKGESVVIGGWLEENGRFRSLLAGVPDGDGLRYVGKIGTGYGHGVVQHLVPRLHDVRGDSSPFVSGPAPTRGAHWAEPKLVAEVEFAGWSTDRQLRQAAFKGLREDIEPREVELEPEANAPAAAARATNPNIVRSVVRTPGTAKIRGVAISHSDKELWPAKDGAPAVTKLELAQYYDTVGEKILEHIKGRPCSIVRAPDGIGAETFFQRHAGQGASKLFTQVAVRGDKQPYLQIDSVDALIAAGQIGGVELHPWNCQPGMPEVPGRLVFDLDPAPDVGFDEVVEAAKELRERLAAVGLESFCKTTGGKGLHVVTPFKHAPKQDLKWPEAKAFALEVCRQMAADSPDDYLVVMAKAKRTGKIFLDYLRNDRLSTAVAVLSPRARAGAPVSMPVTWSQVRKGLDPKRYTIATAPALIAKSDPWADYDDAARPFAPAAKKLLKA